jgi:hypothetical protein
MKKAASAGWCPVPAVSLERALFRDAERAQLSRRKSLTSFADACIGFSTIEKGADSLPRVLRTRLRLRPVGLWNRTPTDPGMSDHAEAVVRDYYDALRNGDPLAPYFREAESTVKFGISESLFGGDAVVTALEEQTETTADWTVESRNLVVDRREAFATVADEVIMAWTTTESGERHRFDSRWSGTLVPAEADSSAPDWRFALMHVSAPHEL